MCRSSVSRAFPQSTSRALRSHVTMHVAAGLVLFSGALAYVGVSVPCDASVEPAGLAERAAQALVNRRGLALRRVLRNGCEAILMYHSSRRSMSGVPTCPCRGAWTAQLSLVAVTKLHCARVVD